MNVSALIQSGLFFFKFYIMNVTYTFFILNATRFPTYFIVLIIETIIDIPVVSNIHIFYIIKH